MMSDGITCAKCDGDENKSLILFVSVVTLVVGIFSLLVHLRIRSATLGRWHWHQSSSLDNQAYHPEPHASCDAIFGPECAVAWSTSESDGCILQSVSRSVNMSRK